MKSLFKFWGALWALSLICLPLTAAYQPTPENLAAREWFQNARFGMFVHWGCYSVLADGEWVMNNRKIPISEYEQAPPMFDPVHYDPAQWVSLVKAAGMKYITITSKHHDGFAMFGTKLTNWNIVDRTPYKKDVLKMLADECHRQGIKLFFYYSQLDWHNPDYYPRGRTGRTAGRPNAGDWYRYLDFMDGQLRELLTNYGDIGGIWFDGMWDKPEADWRLEKTYSLIHGLQPAALVGSNHHRLPFDGEDFQMFEKDLPGGHTASFNKESQVGKLPLETCETINGAWGYNQNDQRYKSVHDLIQYLVRAAGHNANFLLNVGPRPDGTIQPEFAERLRQMGAWLQVNGDSIYGTREGPVPPADWGVTTQKGNQVYVHILKNDDNVLALPKLPRKIAGASLLSGAKVPYAETPDGVILKLDPAARDPYDTVVALELQ